MEPVMEIPDDDPRFSLSGFDPAYPRVSTWAEFVLDETAARRSVYWSSVMFRSSDGRGYGELTRESAGIRDAYADAVRAAGGTPVVVPTSVDTVRLRFRDRRWRFRYRGCGPARDLGRCGRT